MSAAELTSFKSKIAVFLRPQEENISTSKSLKPDFKKNKKLSVSPLLRTLSHWWITQPPLLHPGTGQLLDWAVWLLWTGSAGLVEPSVGMLAQGRVPQSCTWYFQIWGTQWGGLEPPLVQGHDSVLVMGRLLLPTNWRWIQHSAPPPPGWPVPVLLRIAPSVTDESWLAKALSDAQIAYRILDTLCACCPGD